MPQLLALDYGKKRTGIAVTDDEMMMAFGLTTVHTEQLHIFLKDYFAKHEIVGIVLGEPKRLNGEDTHSSEAVRKLKEALEKKFKKAVHMVDERFTSKMAFQSMIDSGMKKKQRQNKALVDEISATIILQSYLAQLEHQKGG